ncbi:type VII secretion integral membrane protein EccD [Micromonospora arborensis]|nr:type VII secretion integral membrane protein EccD [Micromonospora arborensis]
MSVAAPVEMCRLVVSGPGRQIDVAVPTNVLVADLLPALLHHLGGNLADAGLDHGGWVLQRLGGPPLDEESTAALLGLQDGETVYLRPRSDQIPPVDFDDLADGLATGVRGRSALWRPEMIRWSALGLFAIVLALGAIVLALSGPPLGRAICAGVVLLLCMGGAFGLTRAGADRAFGIVAAVGAIGYAGLAGMIVPDLTRDSSALVVGSPQLFSASVAVVTTAALTAMLVGWAGPFFAAIISAGLLSALGSALAAFVSLNAGQAAAVIAVVATVATIRVPLLAFRLARIYLPPLPTEPEHLQEDIDPEPSEQLLARTAVADRYMSGLYAGMALVVGVCLVVLARSGGWAPWTVLALVCLIRLLALRPMTSGWHRLAHALPAVTGLVVLALISVASAATPVRLALSVAVPLLGGLVLFALGRWLPERRLMPYWGRIGDILQLVSTVALVPVLLAALGVYEAVRALAG